MAAGPEAVQATNSDSRILENRIPAESVCPDGMPAVSGPGFRVNNFDLLRILAAMQVMVIHSLARLQIPVPAGLKWLEWFPGVPIFFIISGYLVSASFERESTLPRYFKNRFIRIYPGLWVCVGIVVIVTAGLGYRRSNLLDFAWLPAQLLGIIYTPDFLKHFGAGTYNGALWTIPIELQFYLLLPLVYFVQRRFRKGNAVVPFFLALSIAVSLLLHYSLPAFDTPQESRIDKLIRYSFFSSFYLFLFGIALQRIGAFRSKLVAGKGLYWIAAYVLFRIALPQVLSPALTVLSFLFLGIAAVSVAYTVPSASGRILQGQDISYGVYIYHGLLINLLIESRMPRGLYQIPIIVVSSLMVGGLSWKLVEQPFLRKKRRRLQAGSFDVSASDHLRLQPTAALPGSSGQGTENAA